MFIELSETNNQIRSETSELLSDSKNLLSSGTANLPKTSDVNEGDDDEEQESDDENDLLVLFWQPWETIKNFSCWWILFCAAR